MSTGLQKSLAWCGVAFVLVLFPGLLMAGLLPPIPPTRTAEQVAQFWATNTGLKRCGLVLMLAGSALPVPFSTLIAARMKQLEGRFTPLTYAQIIGAALSVVAIGVPVCAFAAASYRPERDPQITQALNDLGWLALVMFWPPATVQCLAIGFAVLGYRGTAPIWPRWMGYYNLWIAFIFAAGGLAVLFKTGVFAWNGLLAFWLVAAFFGTWYLVMTWQLLTTISQQPIDPGDDPDGNRLRLQHAPQVIALAMPGGAAPRTPAPRRIPGEEGIWVFVLGDMTVFALFFATFMYSRGKNPHAFSQDHHSLNIALGTANTVLLLSSSLFVALGVTRVMAGNHGAAFGLFASALGCGAGFVMIKTVEWSHLFLAGKSVGNSEYFSYYFMFTGIHLMHVLIGAAALCRLIWLTRQPELSERQRTMCETGAIFWHMVDLLWVVLFALFYLLA